MDAVTIRSEEPVRYVSRSKQIDAAAIDAYVKEAISELEATHTSSGRPFSIYHGCSVADEQIVEVCLPTSAGDQEMPGQEVAFTVVRDDECDYPQILAAYNAVVAYAAAEGRELDGPPRETYLTDPSAAPEMEIAFPLRARWLLTLASPDRATS